MALSRVRWTSVRRVNTLVIWMDQNWDVWTDVRIDNKLVPCDGSESGILD